MGQSLDAIWIDTFFFCNGRKTTISNIQHPFGKLSLLFRIGYHDSHVDMKTKNHNMLPKMQSKQRSTNNVFLSSLGNNRQDLSKIPTKDHNFPTKDFFGCVCVIQLHQITQGSINNFESLAMHHQCLVPNDQIILCTNSATFICCVMLQVDSSCISIRILNLEWVVLLPRSNKDAIPDEAIASTILPCPHKRDRSIVQTNVLPVPPLPYIKNNLPSLFVMTFKIVSYALC